MIGRSLWRSLVVGMLTLGVLASREAQALDVEAKFEPPDECIPRSGGGFKNGKQLIRSASRAVPDYNLHTACWWQVGDHNYHTAHVDMIEAIGFYSAPMDIEGMPHFEMEIDRLPFDRDAVEGRVESLATGNAAIDLTHLSRRELPSGAEDCWSYSVGYFHRFVDAYPGREFAVRAKGLYCVSWDEDARVENRVVLDVSEQFSPELGHEPMADFEEEASRILSTLEMVPGAAAETPKLPKNAPRNSREADHIVRTFLEVRAIVEAKQAAREFRASKYLNAHQLRQLLVEAFYEYGKAYYANDAFEEAISAFSETITLMGQRHDVEAGGADTLKFLADAHHRRGRAHQKFGQLEEAIADFVEATHLDPENHVFHWRLGFWTNKTGDYELAVRSFERSLEIKPDYANALSNLAWLRVAAGTPQYRDIAQALRLIREAIKLRETSSNLTILGAALASNGEKAAALKAYMRAIDRSDVRRLRLADKLVYLECLDADETFFPIWHLENALRVCIDKGWLPFKLSEAVQRIERIVETDPLLAAEYLEFTRKEFEGHPEIIRLDALVKVAMEN